MLLTEYKKVLKQAQQVLSSDLPDETKFDFVFSKDCSKIIHKICNQLHCPLDYYDPDSSYLEDCRAFISAAEDKLPDLEKMSVILFNSAK